MFVIQILEHVQGEVYYINPSTTDDSKTHCETSTSGNVLRVDQGVVDGTQDISAWL